jgi:hypothetical protein
MPHGRIIKRELSTPPQPVVNDGILLRTPLIPSYASHRPTALTAIFGQIRSQARKVAHNLLACLFILLDFAKGAMT